MIDIATLSVNDWNFGHEVGDCRLLVEMGRVLQSYTENHHV